MNKNKMSILYTVNKEEHNSKYSFDPKVRLVGKRDDITVTCNIHGDFITTHSKFKKAKYPCTDCRTIYRNDRLIEGHLNAFTAKWGDKFDYSKVTIESLRSSKIIVGCPIHGWQEVTITLHRTSYLGCKPCNKDRRIQQYQDDRDLELSSNKQELSLKKLMDNNPITKWTK